MKKILVFAAVMLIGVVGAISAQTESDNGGILIVPPIYDAITNCENGYMIVSKDGKKGVIDSNGKLIIPVEYDYIEYSHNNNPLFVVKKKDEASTEPGFYGLLNNKGQIVAPLKYEDIKLGNGYQFKGLIKIKVLKELIERPTDMISETGEVVTYQIDTLRITTEGVIDSLGNIIVEPKYDRVDIEGGLIQVENGVLNGKGVWVVPSGKYENVHIYVSDDFSLEYIHVRNPNTKVESYLNAKGETIISNTANYKDIRNEGPFFWVEYPDRKQGVIGQTGHLIVPARTYQTVDIKKCERKDGYFIEVESNGKKGLFNQNGKLIAPLGKYQKFHCIEQTFVVAVTPDGQYTALDFEGRVLVALRKYDEISSIKHGSTLFIKATKSGKSGILNNKGQEIIPLQYKQEKIQAEGNFIIASDDTKSTVFTREGKQFIIFDPTNSILSVFTNDGQQDFTINGNELNESNFELELRRFEGMPKITINNITTIYDTQGNILAPAGRYNRCVERYGKIKPIVDLTSAIPFKNGLIKMVSPDGKVGVVKLW